MSSLPTTAALAVIALALAAGPAAGEAAAPDRADRAAIPLADAIAAALAPTLPVDVGIAAIHLPPSLASTTVAPHRVAVTPPARMTPGRRSVRVAIGRRTSWISVSFAALGPAVVARRTLPAGAPIVEGDLVAKWAPIAPGAPETITAVAGAIAIREIPAGAAITADAIELPPPSPRGAEVAVVAVSGGARVTTRGVLEAAARPGQIVPVRLRELRAVARGTFVAPATVMLGGRP